MDLRDILRELAEGNRCVEDKTVFVRETPSGARTDFEIIERTTFRGYPETVKEMRSKGPLACGHPVTKENPFGGYCQGKHGQCGAEYCARWCGLQCPRCGVFVSAHCCAHEHDGVLLCKPCAKKLARKRFWTTVLTILIAPFISDGDEEEPGSRPARPSHAGEHSSAYEHEHKSHGSSR